MNATCRSWIAVCFLVVFLASCAGSASQPVSPAYWPTQGWKTTTPEEQGMDSQLLAQMVEQIQADQLKLHSLLVVRNGYLVSEIYPYPYTASQPHWIASVTKSVVSALVGIAIDRGSIKNVHQPLNDFFPNLAPDKKEITLENLLTLTTGIACQENPAPGTTMLKPGANWVDYVLNQPVVDPPGRRFNYCTDQVHLLSAILQKSTGMTAREFANQNLFAPLGIDPIPEQRWPSDPQEITIGGYGLALTPAEMAKFGFLILNQGKWDGKAIISPGWVRDSTITHIQKNDGNGYGYLWTIDPHRKYFSALGRGGEHIFVFPAENLVVVFTAGLPASNNADYIPLEKFLNQYILPAVKSGRPLQANPTALSRYQAGVAALAQPKRAVQPLPSVAAAISGKTFTLADNPLGWRQIVFTFKDGAEEAQATVDGSTLLIGMDNVFRYVPGTDPIFPHGVRGQWVSEDTLLIQDIYTGQMMDVEYTIQFIASSLRITRRENISGVEMKLAGSLE
ncbi:MAG TPA: serine hydrolase [Anaerolineaceae bacterium]|nr:serine hydrolase [Anaerolineaceae bacterium]